MHAHTRCASDLRFLFFSLSHSFSRSSPPPPPPPPPPFLTCPRVCPCDCGVYGHRHAARSERKRIKKCLISTSPFLPLPFLGFPRSLLFDVPLSRSCESLRGCAVCVPSSRHRVHTPRHTGTIRSAGPSPPSNRVQSRPPLVLHRRVSLSGCTLLLIHPLYTVHERRCTCTTTHRVPSLPAAPRIFSADASAVHASAFTRALESLPFSVYAFVNMSSDTTGQYHCFHESSPSRLRVYV